MQSANYTVFKCLNPECGKPIKLVRPQKSGIIAVECPHCNIKKHIRIKGLEELQQAVETTRTTDDSTNQAVDNSAQSPILIKEDFFVDQEYQILCPHCGAFKLVFKSEKAGKKPIECPHCKGKVGLVVKDRTKVLEEGLPYPGKIQIVKRFSKKDYPLREGVNIIGRSDSESPSDISIDNDPTMSRRSVSIDVKNTPMGWIFKLTVLKSTNPVLFNQSEINPGESLYLKYGDLIILGKTKFRFDKNS